MLNRGVAYVRQNKPHEWQADFAYVLAQQPADVRLQQALCWAYALDQQPERTVAYCDTAVLRDGEGYSRQARAVVLAEQGRLDEAAAELKRFLDWLARQPAGLRARHGSVPGEWLEALKAGQNPIDRAALERLRQQ